MTFTKVIIMPDNIAPMWQDMISSLHDKIGQMEERGQQAEKQLTPLMRVAEAGDADVVCKLLEEGCDLNTETDGGWTALKKAVSGQHPTIIHLLVQHGAILSTNVHGFTALHLAATLNDVPCAQALLDCGADLNVQETEFGQTPLMEAMSEGDGDFMGPDVARMLIERGADRTIQSTHGSTVLDYALDYQSSWSAFPDSVWLGESQRSLIELVRLTVATQAKAKQAAT